MNTKRIPFHGTLRRDSETTENHTQIQANQKKQSERMIAISFPATQPNPRIYWYTITPIWGGGGGNFVQVSLRTAEGH